MILDSVAFWTLASSAVFLCGAVLLLMHGVRRAEKPLVWNILGLTILILTCHVSYQLYSSITGGRALSLTHGVFQLTVALGLLASVVLCRPFFNLHRRNRELLAVIEERNVIIHQFHERIARALRQVQIALEVGKPAHFIVDQVAELNKILQVFLEDLKAGVLLGNKFEVALKTLVDDLSQQCPFPISIQVDASAVQNLSYDVGTELLHITREAVKNCVEHSKAKKGWVIVRKTESTLTVEVADNGQGFEVDLVGAQGHGLGNMVLRAKNINARLKVNSQPKKGTAVLIEIPLVEKPSNGTQTPSKTSGFTAETQKAGISKRV